MPTRTSGQPSCQVRVAITVSHTGKSSYSVLCIRLTCSLNTFQSCTATPKDQSLSSTGSASRWSSENMVRIKLWIQSIKRGIEEAFCSVLTCFFFCLFFSVLSFRKEVGRAGRGGAQGSRHAPAGRPGGDCQGEEAEGGQSDTLHDAGSVDGIRTQFSFKAAVKARAICQCSFVSLCPSSGTFAECSSETEVQYWMRYNIFLLLDVGTFSALVELLNMEIEYVFFGQITTVS